MNDTCILDPALDFILGPMESANFAVREVALGARTTGNVRASLFIVAPGGRTDVDGHAVHELWMVVSGSGELRCDGQKFRLTPQTVYYFEPFREHEAINDGLEPLVSYSVWWP